MRTQLGLILAVAGLTITTACAGGVAASGERTDTGVATAVSTAVVGAQQVTIVARDAMRFEPASITATAGQPVQLTLRNEGHAPHDFSLSDGVTRPVKIKADGGKTASATFTIDRPGTYTFICSVPGHEAAGMTGTLVAE